MRLALWLVPEEEAERRLADLIRSLAVRFGSPVFPPHVTLLSGIGGEEAEVESRAAALARRGAPLDAEVRGAEGREEYYRWLALRLASSEALAEARRAAEKVFPSAESTAFDPHLSLVYSNPRGSSREAVLDELRREWSGRVIGLSRLDVVDTSRPVGAWAPAARFRLGIGERSRC